MDFPFGRKVFRDRRQQVPDPYNEGGTTEGSWDAVLDTIEIKQAFIASSSATLVPNPTRSQLVTGKSLYSTDPDVDVQPRDRIRDGATVYFVQVKPEADTNPFTNWRPAVEIPLQNVEG